MPDIPHEMTLWRFARRDIAPTLLILLLPLVVAMPQLSGWLKANPLLYIGVMAEEIRHGPIRGAPMIDPNNGYGTQALGYRAAADWLEGRVPWWNPYTGVGLPLAAEYQGAPFFPPTFLLLLENGMAWLQVALQIASGLGTYALLRQLGMNPLAATAGGLVYAFNGTLAWFSHAPASTVPFLPWMLFGIERARVSAALGLRGGWRMLAVSMAIVLLSAFPELAYISGLLALAWAVLRGIEIGPERRLAFAWRIVLGGLVGIGIAAPQVVPFLQYLPVADLGHHGTVLADGALRPEAVIPSLIAPYAFGTIFTYAHKWPALAHIWGTIGGYGTIALLAVAAYGFFARRDALAWLLLGWCALALAKTFGIEPVATAWNLIPGISLTAFFHYSQPSWILALVILAARGIDEWTREPREDRGAWKTAAAFVAIVLLGSLSYWAYQWPHLRDTAGLRNWAVGSAAWAVITTAGCLALLKRDAKGRAPLALAAILAIDSMLMFAIPTFSNPRGGTLDMRSVAFLRANLGLQRFYTLGPIQPNYGAYFGIASINHNYLPVALRWVEWVRANLDRSADGVVFNGAYPRGPGDPTQAEELRRNLAAYQWVGVKYVVAMPGTDPLAGTGARKVYSSAAMDIHELADPRPYFEVLAGTCAVKARDRTAASVECEGPATLLRRELFFPGWEATVDSREVAITEHRKLFQAVELPAGKSDVRFRYSPPHIAWCWLAALLGLAVLLWPGRK